MAANYAGFDMVPQLIRHRKDDAMIWSRFLGEVAEKYENDPLFSQELLSLQFKLGSNSKMYPILPFQGHTFLRFHIAYINKKNKASKRAFSFVKGVFQLAKKHFGPQVQFWDEGEGQLGHYTWADIERIQRSQNYSIVNEGNKYNQGQAMEGTSDKASFCGGYKKGEIIQCFVPPFVKVLYRSDREIRCTNCMKKSKRLLSCKGCLLVRYCDKGCQGRDWKNGHCFECKSSTYRNQVRLIPNQNTTPNEIDLILKLLRLLCFAKQNRQRMSDYEEIYDGSVKSFTDVVALIQDNDIENMMDLETCSILIGMDLDVDPVFNEREIEQKRLIRFLSVWKYFGEEIPDETGTYMMGCGMYIHKAFFPKVSGNMIAVPTTVTRFLGPLIQVEAATEIPKGSRPTVE